ncbi:hypothetical protein VTL71DRAFT_8608 [Oculimacula yallundae]|uniref:F-box domain-containing protein n=1 Tax=Oculimacula yallundae TaxID=86028 RepID=A0ABR4CY60_9HELO
MNDSVSLVIGLTKPREETGMVHYDRTAALGGSRTKPGVYNTASISVPHLQNLLLSGEIVQGLTIVDFIIERHDIRNCLLVNVHLQDCMVINCTLRNCTLDSRTWILNDKVYGFKVAAWRSTFESCTITNSSIYHSQIGSSILINSRVEVGQIQISKMVQTTLSNLSVDHCDLDRCLVYNCSTVIDTLVNNTRVTTSPLALRRFPPEIRALIFEYTFQDAQSADRKRRRDILWTTSYADLEERLRMLYPHELIKALRGSNLSIYEEAVDVLYKSWTFKLKSGRFMSVEISRSSRQRLRSLSVDSITSLYSSNAIQILETFYQNIQFSELRDLHISLGYDVQDTLNGLMMVGKDWFSRFKKMRRLEVDVGFLQRYMVNMVGEISVCELVTRLNEILTVPGRLSTVGTCGGVSWFWDAGERGLLVNGKGDVVNEVDEDGLHG